MNKYIDSSLSYQDYKDLIDRLLSEGKTTGKNHSEAMINYTKLNRQRMKRLEKTTVISGETAVQAMSVERPMLWLIITEAWCGDAAQNIPVIEKIAAMSGKIETRYLLRDEFPELMDEYLTNGSRSIPKLIAIDKADGSIIGTWGPRPATAQNLYQELKQQGFEKEIVMERLQRWYNSDDSRSIQTEFTGLFRDWGSAVSAKAEVAAR